MMFNGHGRGGNMVPEIVEESNVPLYQQLKNIIKGQILNGVLKTGEKIPPEIDLCSVYGVSRITVRQAINSLAQEGFLYRKQGKGTYVTSPKLRRRLPKLYSFSEDMKDLGLKPSSKVIESEIIEADEEVFSLLKLPENNRKVNKVVRVRLANDEPILIERTYIPLFLSPELLLENLENESLYRLFREKYGLVLDHAYETYEVTTVRKNEAEILNCKKNLPAFAIERITFLKTDVPVELTRSIMRGDRVRFTVQLLADQAQIRRQIEF